MAANVGSIDRGLRLILGLALIIFAFSYTGDWRWVGLAGPVLILTVLVRFCPAYWLLRIRTLARPAGWAA